MNVCNIEKYSAKKIKDTRMTVKIENTIIRNWKV